MTDQQNVAGDADILYAMRCLSDAREEDHDVVSERSVFHRILNRLAAAEAERDALKARLTQSDADAAYEQFMSTDMHNPEGMREWIDDALLPFVATRIAAHCLLLRQRIEEARRVMRAVAQWRDHAITTCIDADRTATTYGQKQDSAKLCREVFDEINTFLANTHPPSAGREKSDDSGPLL